MKKYKAGDLIISSRHPGIIYLAKDEFGQVKIIQPRPNLGAKLGAITYLLNPDRWEPLIMSKLEKLIYGIEN